MMYLFIYYYQLYSTTYDIIKEKLRNHNIIKLKDKSKSHDIYDDVDVKEEIRKLMNRNTNIKKITQC